MTKRAPKRHTRQAEKRPTRQKVIAAVRAWQTSGQMQPLTCGYDSRHRPLEPKAEGPASVVLVCPDCDYVQTDIPPIVLTAGPLLGRPRHDPDHNEPTDEPRGPMVPPSPYDFKETVQRLLKAKPPSKRTRSRES